MTDNPLWDVIQAFMDDPRHRYRPKPADLARETGISEQVFSKWKKRPTLPEPEQLNRLSAGTGINYARLLEAALDGKGYFIAGPSRIVTADFLDPKDEEDFAFDEKVMPFARPLSEPADTPDLAVAAHEEEGSIAGEQEESDTP